MSENWKVGDEAICIKVGGPFGAIYPPLRLGYKYLVHKVNVCECGSVTLDVGLPLTEGSNGTLCRCGATKSPKTGIWWANSNRFTKPKTDKKQAEEAVEELLKEVGISS